MSRSRSSKVLGGVLVAALLGAGCGGGGGGGKAGEDAAPAPQKYDVAKGVDSPAVELRAELTSLLQESALLTGITTSTLLGGGDPAPATAVLDQNSVALSGVVGRFYGEPAATQFLDLWRRHTAGILEFAAASGAADKARVDQAKADITAIQGEIATMVNSVNPQLTVEALEEELDGFVRLLQTAVKAQAEKDPEAPAKLKDAADHMPTTAIVLVAGIVKEKGAKEIPGDFGAMSGIIRTSLTAKLQEHAYLAGITTATALAGGDEGAAAKALDDNSLELSRAIGSVYGDDAGRQFLTLWRQHIAFFVEFTEGAAAGDQARMDGARAKLDGYRDAVGAFLNAANPNLEKSEVATGLGRHVDSLLVAIQAQAANDPAQVLKLREAAGHMPDTALYLATGIARQFPTKFG